MTINIQLSADEFVFKAKDIIETGDAMSIVYDMDRDQIRLVQSVNGYPVSFLSPVICAMPEAEYQDMKGKLDALIPDQPPVIGRIWW